ncbi:MAG: GTP-binding protein [Firmicutes bacterium]|nr:GTP-binding protein [Bacillota bacterium]
MIKLVMLTGFLGSGKTTLLQKLIDEYADHKIGVLINEFGAVSVDSEIIDDKGVQMTELSNGSIFCACLKDQFVDALVKLSGRDLEYLFIEASGLADPANMVDLLKGIEPYLAQKYDYVHAFCIVDGTNFIDMIEVLESLRHQVFFSDIIVINKTDLITNETEAEIRSAIREINPEASVISASYCDFDIVKATDSPSGLSDRSEDTTNAFENRPQTIVLKERKPVIYEDLDAFIKEIAGSTYRIKGFLHTDRGGVKLDCVGENISIEPWEKEIKDAKVVLISSVGIRLVSNVIAALAKYVKGSISL